MDKERKEKIMKYLESKHSKGSLTPVVVIDLLEVFEEKLCEDIITLIDNYSK
jgi:hypothetical protein